jgi:hypothetical protein
LSRRIQFHESALDEFREAARWYERQRQGLGEEFLEAVETLLERAASDQLPGLAAE